MENHNSPRLAERLMGGETIDTADLGELQGLGSRATSFYERSRVEQTFRPLTAGGIRQSVFVLVQTALGGGVLTIAYMLTLTGLGPGVLLLLAGAVVAYVSMDVLIKSAVRLHRYTFGSLLGAIFGDRSGIFLDLMLFLYGNGSLLTYFIFLSDFLPSILICLDASPYFPWQGLGNIPYADLRARCLVATAFTVTWFALPRDLSAFRFLSPIVLVAILYTEFLVMGACFESTAGHFDQHWRDVDVVFVEFDRANMVHSLSNICKAFSISVFAYCCHLNVVPVAKELNNPADRRIEKISYRVAFVQFVIYFVLAVAGYLYKGSETPQNLLQAFPKESYVALVARILMAMTVLVAVATNTNPTVRALLCLLEIPFSSLRDHDYGQSAQQLSGKSPDQRRPAFLTDKPEPTARRIWRYVFSVVCIFVDMLVAIKVQNVATVVGILGATMGNMMMMVMPLLLIRYVPRLDPLSSRPLYDKPIYTVGIVITLLLAFVVALASMFVG